MAGCQFAYFNAVDRLPVAIAILIEYAAPVAVVGWLWARHHQAPSRLTVTGAAVAIAGLLLVLDIFSVGSVDGLGVLWALVGMVGCAFFFVLSAGDDTGCPRSSSRPADSSLARSVSGLPGSSVSSRCPPAPADATYNGVDVAVVAALLALGW